MTETITPARLRYVLVRTSHPGNIGSAARAIRTMGFSRLDLVRPHRYPDPEADALAAGAPGVLEAARVHESLPDALSGCTLALGMSARRRGVTLPELTPREAAAQAWQAACEGREVALVFGNEQSGLDNAELAHCHAMVRIPSVADYSSLNLAQAVQVLAYEMRLASLGGEGSPVAEPEAEAEAKDPPADLEQMEQFFVHLSQSLHDIDFHKGRSPRTIELRLRKLFMRAQPDQRELRILHGILAEAQRMAQRARGESD